MTPAPTTADAGREAHTPGPWIVSDDVIIAANIGIIARAPNHPENGKNWKNDARLIAAAPDLVKALEEIREGLADTRSTRGQWMTKITKADAHRIAVAALAAAKGAA